MKKRIRFEQCFLIQLIQRKLLPQYYWTLLTKNLKKRFWRKPKIFFEFVSNQQKTMC